MRIECRAEENEASFKVSKKLYRDDSLLVAAHVFENRADCYVEPAAAGAVKVTLEAKRKLDKAALERLAREFLNELLNQEYRQAVGALNRNLAAKLVTQALYSARGGEVEKPQPQLTAEQEAEVRRLLAEAEEETARTMPKRIPPQGTPIPPAS